MEHRCMVLYRRSLLAQAVASIMRTHQQLEVTVADMERVDPLTAVRDADPEVLVLDIDNLEELSGLLGTLFRERPSMKIMLLDSQSRLVYVLEFRQQEIGSAAEFLTTLWGELVTSSERGEQ